MLQIDTYKHYRQAQVNIHSKILDEFVDEIEFKQAANILGILKKDQVVLESYEERDALYDFNIYGKIRNGKSTLSIYMDSYTVDEVETELLNAMSQSDVSLYEIGEIIEEEKILILNDVLCEDRKPIKLVDINASESLNPDLLVCTRLLQLENFSITSGMNFIFHSNHKDYILARSRKMLKKIKSGDDSTDRFIAFFHLNRSDGLLMLNENIES